MSELEIELLQNFGRHEKHQFKRMFRDTHHQSGFGNGIAE
jgi:hypothetical protein